MQGDRDGPGFDDVGDPLGVQGRAGAYIPWALPIAGAKQSIPVASMKPSATSKRLPVRLLIGADAVLDPFDALDLALDVGAVALGFGDDLFVCRWFSSTGRDEASNSTEFHPASRHEVMTSRSGQ